MRTILYAFTAFVIIAIDQWTKWAATEVMLRKSSVSFTDWILDAPERLDFTKIEITPFLNIVMVWNWGVSFGLFNQESGIGPILLIILSCVLILFFVVWLFKVTHPLQKVAILLVIGGALGNVIDRLRFQAVVDFIDIHVLGYHWPAFNFADACISIGCILLLIHLFFFEKNDRNATVDAIE
jgi:signal peptidase II